MSAPMSASVEAWLRSAGPFDQTSAEAWRQLAWKAMQAGRTDAAVVCFREVTRLAPGIVEAWANLGALCARSNQHAQAVECYRRAAAREPKNLDLTKALIRTLRVGGQRDEAVALVEQALVRAPGDADLYHLLGNLCQELDRYDEAVKHLLRAMQLAGRTPPLVSSLGIALFRRGEFDAAAASFREAIARQPDFPEAHFHLGVALLMKEDYDAGWQEYEWRLGGRFHPQTRKPLPIWNGESLHGKILLLAAEQGLGDTMQLVRFARLIKERYHQVRTVLYCQAALARLLKTCPGIDAFTPPDKPLSGVDCFVPLFSIPSVLRFRPQRETAPRGYLRAEADRITAWRSRLNALAAPTPEFRPSTSGDLRLPIPGSDRLLRIGLAWQGDPKFPADRTRSIPMAAFQPLAAFPQIQLVSLQKGFGTEQIADFRRSAKIIDFGDELDRTGGAFLDTAAIIASLDLVITSDTAIGHLAGALGAPVWVALQHVPEWRWHFGRSDSAWYPTARLFRQPKPGDWASVVSGMIAALRAGGRASQTAPLRPE